VFEKAARWRATIVLHHNGFDGRPRAEIKKRWAKSKGFKVARLAKAPDVESNFHPKAVGATRAFEEDIGKGEMGLLCGETSPRRRLGRARQLAASLGWSSALGADGECWSWGFEGETFNEGAFFALVGGGSIWLAFLHQKKAALGFWSHLAKIIFDQSKCAGPKETFWVNAF
jgi:hypothetical protein